MLLQGVRPFRPVLQSNFRQSWQSYCEQVKFSYDFFTKSFPNWPRNFFHTFGIHESGLLQFAQVFQYMTFLCWWYFIFLQVFSFANAIQCEQLCIRDTVVRCSLELCICLWSNNPLVRWKIPYEWDMEQVWMLGIWCWSFS